MPISGLKQHVPSQKPVLNVGKRRGIRSVMIGKKLLAPNQKPDIAAERPKAMRLGMIGRNRPTTNQRLANDAVRPREKVLSRKPMTLLMTSRKTSLLQTDIFI